MKPITPEEIQKIAKLARLSISGDDMDLYTTQMGEIINYVSRLETLDTEHIAPLEHVLEKVNVQREDTVKPSIKKKTALRNAPEADDNFFKVPQVIKKQ